MDAIDALRARRTVRVYEKGAAIDCSTLEILVDCGRLAATARNEQPWEFVVVTEPEGLRRLAAISDYGKHIADAGACIVVFCRDTKYYVEDGSAATQNILTAAWALGLGACWVAGDKKAYADEIRHLLGGAPELKLVSMIAIGKPLTTPNPQKRPLSEVLHWERMA